MSPMSDGNRVTLNRKELKRLEVLNQLTVGKMTAAPESYLALVGRPAPGVPHFGGSMRCSLLLSLAPEVLYSP